MRIAGGVLRESGGAVMSDCQEIEWGWLEYDLQTELDELLETPAPSVDDAEDKAERVAEIMAKLEQLHDVRM